MNVWLTADWHFYHRNIITYCNRPFNDEFEMTYYIFEQMKNIIKDEDVLIVLGDVSIKSSKKWIPNLIALVSSIPGTKILVKGNHDLYSVEIFKEMGFKYVVKYINLGKYTFVHNPENTFKGKYTICGHVHEKWKTNYVNDSFCVNVGVDQWNFKPVRLEEVVPVEDAEKMKIYFKRL